MRRMVSSKAQEVLKSMEMTNSTNMTIGTNLTVDGNITYNGGRTLQLYEHNITVQISVDGDETTDIYGHLTILNTTATEFTLETLTSYLQDNVDNASDYNKVFTASGDRIYTGIGYNGGIVVQAGDSDYDTTAVRIYSDCVIQIL